MFTRNVQPKSKLLSEEKVAPDETLCVTYYMTPGGLQSIPILEEPEEAARLVNAALSGANTLVS